MGKCRAKHTDEPCLLPTILDEEMSPVERNSRQHLLYDYEHFVLFGHFSLEVTHYAIKMGISTNTFL